MAGDFLLEGSAGPDTLERIHELLDQVRLDHPELAGEDVSMLETAIVEVAGNVLRHGHGPAAVDYGVRVRVLSDRLICRLWDSGAELPAVALAAGPPDELSESGRGLQLAAAALDGLDYSRTTDGNVWSMVRMRR